MKKRIKIGTRGSKLALCQTNWVKSELQKHHPSLFIEVIVIKTKGDKIQDVPLAKVGGKGLFVKEIEDAMLAHRVDLAVHSMKDMPADFPEGLMIGAVPNRETAGDVLIAKDNRSLKSLRPGDRVGTSSLRRSAQIRHVRPDLEVVSLRGNLDTRIKKLNSGDFDAIVVAAAGLIRLQMDQAAGEYLNDSVMVPAVGQGALCVEIRQNDPQICTIVSSIDDPRTHQIVKGERAFLKRIGGSCQVPVGGIGKMVDRQFELTALIAEVDGSKVIRETMSGPLEESEAVGVRLAERLLDMGGDEILEHLEENLHDNDQR